MGDGLCEGFAKVRVTGVWYRISELFQAAISLLLDVVACSNKDLSLQFDILRLLPQSNTYSDVRDKKWPFSFKHRYLGPNSNCGVKLKTYVFSVTLHVGWHRES